MHSRAELNWVEQSREYTHITHRIIPSLASKIKMVKSCRSNRLFGHNSRKVLWPQIMMANKFLAETKSGDHGCCVARSGESFRRTHTTPACEVHCERIWCDGIGIPIYIYFILRLKLCLPFQSWRKKAESIHLILTAIVDLLLVTTKLAAIYSFPCTISSQKRETFICQFIIVYLFGVFQ